MPKMGPRMPIASRMPSISSASPISASGSSPSAAAAAPIALRSRRRQGVRWEVERRRQQRHEGRPRRQGRLLHRRHSQHPTRLPMHRRSLQPQAPWLHLAEFGRLHLPGQRRQLHLLLLLLLLPLLLLLQMLFQSVWKHCLQAPLAVRHWRFWARSSCWTTLCAVTREQ